MFTTRDTTVSGGAYSYVNFDGNGSESGSARSASSTPSEDAASEVKKQDAEKADRKERAGL